MHLQYMFTPLPPLKFRKSQFVPQPHSMYAGLNEHKGISKLGLMMRPSTSSPMDIYLAGLTTCIVSVILV